VRAVAECRGVPFLRCGAPTPVEVIVGIEMRDGEAYYHLHREAKNVAHLGINNAGELAWGGYRPGSEFAATPIAELATLEYREIDAATLAHLVEVQITKRWPDRAYFIEVCVGGERDGWVQIFQPWERPA
jgi:hypothetical protein